MLLEKEYRFNAKGFLKDGFDSVNNKLFTELIKDFQTDFSEEFPFTPANFLHINFEGMQLIKACFITEEEDLSDETFGMDLLEDDMEMNFEINQKMDSAGTKRLVYAISTEFDPDEPLFLILDNEVPQNTLVLKYISDSDDEEQEPDLVDSPSVVFQFG